MKKHLTALLFLEVLVFSATYISCVKSNSPLGVYAPNGADVPTTTPTPSIGAIQVYVTDQLLNSGNNSVQDVSIYLLEPNGNTFAMETTQPVVGYAAFNPSSLISGIWTAVVPAQSVTNQIGITQIFKRTYGHSSLPITVSGGGQYSATFTTGSNSVAISPVSQAMGMSLPDFLPITVNYSENGNLDVPVSVALQGDINLNGFSWQNPITWAFGGFGPNFAPATLVKNQCYFNQLNLTLNANDYSGNYVPTSGASIVKGWSIPVTLFLDKHAIGIGNEVCNMKISSSNDCGATVYSMQWQIGGSCCPAGGTLHGPVALASGQSAGVTYYGPDDPYVTAYLTYPGGGQIIASQQMQYLQFDSFQDWGEASY